MLEAEVNRGPVEQQLQGVAPRMVGEELKGPLRVFGACMVQVGADVPASVVFRFIHVDGVGRRHDGQCFALACTPHENVAVDGERCVRVRLPIHTCAQASRFPVVIGSGAVAEFAFIALSVVQGKSVVQVVAGGTAVAHQGVNGCVGGPDMAQQRAGGVPGGLCPDVDHAIHGVGAPERAARASNDLDAGNVFEGNVVMVPPHAGEVGRVDASAVDHDQQFVGEAVVESPHRDGVLVAVLPGNTDAWHVAQQLGQGPRAGAPDIFLSKHVDGGGDFVAGFLLARGAGDLDFKQFLEAEFRKVPAVLRRCDCTGNGNAEEERAQSCEVRNVFPCSRHTVVPEMY